MLQHISRNTYFAPRINMTDISTIEEIANFLAQGGSVAVIAILTGIIAWMGLDRRSLVKSITETTEKVYAAKDRELESIKEIVDRYHKGQVDLVHALNEIKSVLVTIQSIQNHAHHVQNQSKSRKSNNDDD